MKKLLLSLFVVFISTFVFSQDRSLNKVKLLYNQKNYRMSYWRADELLSNPEYDTSFIPSFYKSLSLFYLQDKFLFRKRDLDPWIEASTIFKEIKAKKEGKLFLKNHKDEISELRDYLLEELAWLKTKQDIKKTKILEKSLKDLFDGISLNPTKIKSIKEDNSIKKNEVKNIDNTERKKIIDYAQNLIGVPYLFGGDSLDGFDCSGFTSYVYQNIEYKLDRSSRDQYQMCKKIAKEEIQPGDLIFFNSGAEEVTHVGIIVSNQGEPLKMIHSSTSKGVIVTDVESSEYWMKKLHGFGTFF